MNAIADKRLPLAQFFCVACLMAAVVGVAAGSFGVLFGGLLVVIALLAMASTLIISKRHMPFLLFLVIVLIGYQTLGKSFAYVGRYPVYVSEVALILGVLSVILLMPTGSLALRRCHRAQLGLLLLFMLWGATRTAPYIPRYGFTALRDGVLWGYGVFALAIVLLLPTDTLLWLFQSYGRAIPYLLAWTLVGPLLQRYASFHVPGTQMPLIWLKSGDAGVHLAGIAAYMLAKPTRTKTSQSITKSRLLWVLWIGAWVYHGAANRGGLFAALVGIAIPTLFRFTKRRLVRAVLLSSIVLIAGLLALQTQLIGQYSGQHGVSGRFITGVTSTFGGKAIGDQLSTRSWRLNWWGEIIDYTLRGDYFWTGKGFGVNLASDDGFGTWSSDETPNRHPHNVFMNILARSGVIGLCIWLAFLTSVCLRLYRVARLRNPRADYALWMFAYLLAFLLNASFDVFLEGPMGGVWFWSLLGMALVWSSDVAAQQCSLSSKLVSS